MKRLTVGNVLDCEDTTCRDLWMIATFKEMEVVELAMKQVGCRLMLVMMIVGDGFGMDERKDGRWSWA